MSDIKYPRVISKPFNPVPEAQGLDKSEEAEFFDAYHHAISSGAHNRSARRAGMVRVRQYRKQLAASAKRAAKWLVRS